MNLYTVKILNKKNQIRFFAIRADSANAALVIASETKGVKQAIEAVKV